MFANTAVIRAELEQLTGLDAVRGLLGGNNLRVAERVWR